MNDIKDRIGSNLSKLENSLNEIKTALENKNVTVNSLKASNVPDKIREIELDPLMFTISSMEKLYSDVEGVIPVASKHNKINYTNLPVNIVFTDQSPPEGVKVGKADSEDLNNKIVTWRDKNTDTLYISSGLKGQKIYLPNENVGATDLFFTAQGNYEETGSNIKTIDLKMLDISNNTSLYGLFHNLISLIELKNLETWDTSHITNFNSFFMSCSSIESINLTNFSTESATNFYSMFQHTESLATIEFGEKFKTDTVNTMAWMFSNSGIEKIDLSKFNTKNVTDMSHLFNKCINLTTIEFGDKFTTENVTSFDNMFASCSNLTYLDLSNFKISNVTNMYDMFNQDLKLKNIYAQEWSKNHNSNLNSGYMFNNCRSLPNFDINNNTKDITLAKWKENGGYFTNPNEK